MYGAVVAVEWLPQTPPLKDFVVSPGFAGGTIAFAAIIAFAAFLYASRRTEHRHRRQLEQRDRLHQEDRAERDRETRIRRCWDRFVWLVDAAASEPTGLGVDHGEHALLGLSPELTLAILQGLHREALDLGDGTLIDAVAVYLTQFSAVLTQEGGPVATGETRNGRHEGPKLQDHGAGPESGVEAPTPAATSTAARKGRSRS
jgi:hypothetical protein